MSKPADIPQDVWDNAVQCAAVVFEANIDLYEFGISGGDPHLVIARAIMAAKAEERQVFVEMIEQFGSAKLIRHCRAALSKAQGVDHD